MKKAILSILAIFVVTVYFYGQEKQLTKQQKVKDFQCLYKTLKENYPFFGVNKRIHNTDWLSNKKSYLEQIKNTKTDFEFLAALKQIISDLNDGHVSFLPTRYHSDYIKVYRQITEQRGDDYYTPWIKELELVDEERTTYWKTILDSISRQEKTNEEIEEQAAITYDYKLEFVKHSDSKTAIIKIPTFNHFEVKKDKDTIFSFLTEISDYQNLIIDVQGNGGGSTSYWTDNIVSKLISDTIFYTTYTAIKNGKCTNRFFNHLPSEKKKVAEFDIPAGFPAELEMEDLYIRESSNHIEPDQAVSFNGKIFLLVDDVVFSASETFAIFCKASGWATVVGKTTKGGGGGTDPLLLALPESGIIINYSGTIGLNPDFSINKEVKTIPDIKIEGESKEERLDNFIKYLTEKQLTKKQKADDFLYAYETLKENYSYFGVCKRRYGIDWLAKKEQYIKKVENTQNDTEYILALKEIFGDLNDGHVNFSCTRYGNEGYYILYKNAAKEWPRYSKWVAVLEDPKARIDYWSEILISHEKLEALIEENTNVIQKPPPNYSDTLINNKEIGIMNILSFNGNLIESDKIAIDGFLNQIKHCKYLIINIHDNGGGAANYWKRNIVERLIADTVIYTSYPVIKDGPVNRHFYNDFFDEAKPLHKTDALPNIPDEVLKENYYVKVDRDTIIPNSPVDFKGEIFLLVSKKVFSSSEGFSQFCKTTGWATIAGERTGGDGIGSDPALIILPESGILMSFPSLVGLNHDGSLNAEEKTVPDIEIKGANSQERLKRLIDYLQNR